MIMLLMLLPCIAYAQDFKIEMVNLYRNSSGGKYQGELTADIMLTNNSGRFLEYCQVTVALLHAGKTVATKSRPFLSISNGAFHSKVYRFGYYGEMDRYRYSVTRVQYGN